MIVRYDICDFTHKGIVMNIKKSALALGSGLLVGSVSGVLPTFQFVCFVLGICLLNYGYLRKS
ncbi:hypothetical protein GBN25_03650 [Plesiomonas shigelloides]|nr:hypothetical protein GBN25_03650 [Plesiomonas shigelloides]